MKRYTYPDRSTWDAVTRRPQPEPTEDLRSKVRDILQLVRAKGDQALAECAQTFDGFVPVSWSLSTSDRDAALEKTPKSLREAIDRAIETIRAFHSAQLMTETEVETAPGVRCWRKSIPIERVGLYIPGGSAPLFSTLLMLAVPAKVAGCNEIALTTPVGADGISPAIAYAAQQLGVDEIYTVGGAQAVAALAYGTQSVRKVQKIFGPGNRFVTEAKLQLAASGTPIDLPAGPSEVLVIADDGAEPAVVAADLLAQAEHGGDSQVVLVTVSEKVANLVQAQCAERIAKLPRGAIAAEALTKSVSVVVRSLNEAVAFSNLYAPEHLIISTANAEELVPLVRNAGSVFVGYLTPESFGDYASGTNHVLPTGGAAVAMSGVSVDSFVKKVTFQQTDTRGIRELGPTVVTMAEAEGLLAHAEAVTVRMEKLV